MAVIFDNLTYDSSKSMGLPLNIKRGNPAALDHSSTWHDWDAMVDYAQNSAIAYVGQVITFYGQKVADGPDVVEAYIIGDETGTLIKLASTTASGDLVSDVATLQSQVNTLISQVGKAAEGDVAATGLFKAVADADAKAEAKVASVAKGDNSIAIGGTAKAPTVAVAISSDEDNALALVADGLKVIVSDVVHPEYSVQKLTNASAGASASYQLTKDDVGVGAVIDIPKDMVVSSGSVVTKSEAGAWGEAGTYIELVIANASQDKLYIPVNSLIEYLSSGSNTATDKVILSIDDSTHKITASVRAGSIELADLHTDLQAAIGNANSAIQSVAEGSANGTISVDGEDVAVHGLGTAAYKAEGDFEVAGAAAAAKSELLGDATNPAAETIRGVKKAAEDAASAASGAASAAQAAQSTADGKVTKLASAVAAGTYYKVTINADGLVTVGEDALADTDIPELAISKITGLQDALDDKVAVESGKSLVDDEEISKLATVAENAEKNVINSVNTTDFTVSTERVLSLNDIAISKVTGLQAALDAKAAASDLQALDTRVSALEANNTWGELQAP